MKLSTIKKQIDCPHCGKLVKDDWKFCPYCKNRLITKENFLQNKVIPLITRVKQYVCTSTEYFAGICFFTLVWATHLVLIFILGTSFSIDSPVAASVLFFLMWFPFISAIIGFYKSIRKKNFMVNLILIILFSIIEVGGALSNHGKWDLGFTTPKDFAIACNVSFAIILALSVIFFVLLKVFSKKIR